MIKIDQRPCAVIKHYKVEVTAHTTYNEFLIHNEKTGEIEMTSDGMPIASWSGCVKDVIRIFKDQMGLNADGKKYRLGNQPEEYGLITKYHSWLPEGGKTWDDLLSHFSLKNGQDLVMTNPKTTEKVTIVMHQQIQKDAFPMSFFGEERARDWVRFCIISTKDNPSEKFIIPLH